MKNTASVLASALVCLTLAVPVWAQETAEVAGRWEMTNETPRGTQTSTFTFEQEGNRLTGTVANQRGKVPINSGSVDGNVVTFKVRSRGNRNTEITYTGAVDGDTIQGSMMTPRGERTFTMTRAEAHRLCQSPLHAGL